MQKLLSACGCLDEAIDWLKVSIEEFGLFLEDCDGTDFTGEVEPTLDCLKKVREGEIAAPKKPIKETKPNSSAHSPQNMQEISLKEASKKEPIPFHQKKEPSNHGDSPQKEGPKNPHE